VVPTDVLVLAGDVHHGTKGLEWARAHFVDVPIVYVAGNHEYYGEAMPKLTGELHARAAELGVHFLENTMVDVAGVRFLGCTLWTDLRLFGPDPMVTDVVMNAMLDYRSIRVSPEYRRLRPADTIRAHRASIQWLQKFVGQKSERTIVVTHHAPSARSIAPEHADDFVSAAYASRLDPLIEALSPTVWVHGHTHHGVDYRIGNTRVVSNARGYVDETRTGFVPGLVLDV
jgi:predicted phosphodiesterase